MYVYSKDELKKMRSDKLTEFNNKLDKVAEEIELEWDEELIELSKLVDQATTQEECHRRFINYINEKQFEVREGWYNYSKEISIDYIIKMLTK